MLGLPAILGPLFLTGKGSRNSCVLVLFGLIDP